MTTFNDLFGGSALLPANATFLSLSMTEDEVLRWPMEQQFGGPNVVADIIEVDATDPGLNIDMPDARVASQGLTTLFNNVGTNTVTIRDSSGGTIISLASGTCWMAYLVDNSTQAGVWRVFQFGASVSVANAAALAGAGLKAIGTTLNERMVISPKAATPYTVVDNDRASMLNWTSGTGTFDLPAAATVGSDWFVWIRNSGTGDLTVTPPAGTIDGAASKTFPAGSSGMVVTDGTNYFTLGFGSGSSGGGSSGFDFLTINVAGSGNYTLAGAELGKVGYRFTGVLTGDRNIIVPGSTDEYWVDNQTTGAFHLFVKTAAQVPGVEVLQNNQAILYCDGTNVVSASSTTVVFPISVAQGGTGAVTAAAARVNLEASTVGNAVFTAATAAIARTALGSGAVGDAVFLATTQAGAQTALGISSVATTLLAQTTQALMRTTGLGMSTIGSNISVAADAAAVRTLTGAAAAATTVTGTNSVSGGGDLSANRTLQLVNDTASPGASMLYGTDGAGTKGWFAQPAVSANPTFTSVGIGVAADTVSGHLLCGEIRCTGNVYALYSSDARLKSNVQPIREALCRVMELRGVEFDWNQDYLDSEGGEHSYFLPKHHAGFIAQEVERVWPVAVRMKADGTKMLVPHVLLPLLWEAVKELAARIPL